MTGLNPGWWVKISKPRMRAKILGFLKNPLGSRMASLGNYTVLPRKGGIVNIRIATYRHNATMHQGRTSDLRAFARRNSWGADSKTFVTALTRHFQQKQGWHASRQKCNPRAQWTPLLFIHLAKQNGLNRTSRMERRLIFVELSWRSNLTSSERLRRSSFGRVDLLASKSERKSFGYQMREGAPQICALVRHAVWLDGRR